MAAPLKDTLKAFLYSTGNRRQSSGNCLRHFSPLTRDLDIRSLDELETTQGQEASSISQLEKLCLSTESQTPVPQTQQNSICGGQW